MQYNYNFMGSLHHLFRVQLISALFEVFKSIFYVI